jgi:hypothetical protein
MTAYTGSGGGDHLENHPEATTESAMSGLREKAAGNG